MNSQLADYQCCSLCAVRYVAIVLNILMKGNTVKHRQTFKKEKKYPILLQLLFVLVPLTQSVLYATGGTPTGNGTIAEPFLVADYSDLKVVGKSATFPGSAVYRLVADIDASASQTENSGAGFVPINDSSIHYFTGTFLGAGHVIKNLHINRSGTDYIGLFGNVWGGMIDSLGLLDANIMADSGYVGSVVSYNNTGTITNCYATGSVTISQGIAGGLAGWSDGTISSCFSTANVTGTDYVGGLLGVNDALASNCYAIGTVSGRNYVGGIAGDNIGTLTNCYAIGNVTGSGSYIGGIAGGNSISTNCYWDTLTTGCTSGYGVNSNTFSGSGLTTTEMHQSSSYSGWNFSTVWSISPSINNGYPYLMANVMTSVEAAAVGALKTFSLLQNFPNPFNPSTVISYQLIVASPVTLKIYDILGREMLTLVNEIEKAGNYSRQWNAANMSSGVYFYRLQAGTYTETKKLVLLR